ncbi:hypothetical protein B0H14DRAFT_2592510 [Mycena olivaceomarginata]|nr:hypothetical protein B0H14DRAFT_2592510 [Mycena olivaceomarginata]
MVRGVELLVGLVAVAVAAVGIITSAGQPRPGRYCKRNTFGEEIDDEEGTWTWDETKHLDETRRKDRSPPDDRGRRPDLQYTQPTLALPQPTASQPRVHHATMDLHGSPNESPRTRARHHRHRHTQSLGLLSPIPSRTSLRSDAEMDAHAEVEEPTIQRANMKRTRTPLRGGTPVSAAGTPLDPPHSSPRRAARASLPPLPALLASLSALFPGSAPSSPKVATIPIPTETEHLEGQRRGRREVESLAVARCVLGVSRGRGSCLIGVSVAYPSALRCDSSRPRCVGCRMPCLRGVSAVCRSAHLHKRTPLVTFDMGRLRRNWFLVVLVVPVDGLRRAVGRRASFAVSLVSGSTGCYETVLLALLVPALWRESPKPHQQHQQHPVPVTHAPQPRRAVSSFTPYNGSPASPSPRHPQQQQQREQQQAQTADAGPVPQRGAPARHRAPARLVRVVLGADGVPLARGVALRGVYPESGARGRTGTGVWGGRGVLARPPAPAPRALDRQRGAGADALPARGPLAASAPPRTDTEGPGARGAARALGARAGAERGRCEPGSEGQVAERGERADVVACRVRRVGGVGVGSGSQEGRSRDRERQQERTETPKPTQVGEEPRTPTPRRRRGTNDGGNAASPGLRSPVSPHPHAQHAPSPYYRTTPTPRPRTPLNQEGTPRRRTFEGSGEARVGALARYGICPSGDFTFSFVWALPLLLRFSFPVRGWEAVAAAETCLFSITCNPILLATTRCSVLGLSVGLWIWVARSSRWIEILVIRGRSDAEDACVARFYVFCLRVPERRARAVRRSPVCLRLPVLVLRVLGNALLPLGIGGGLATGAYCPRLFSNRDVLSSNRFGPWGSDEVGRGFIDVVILSLSLQLHDVVPSRHPNPDEDTIFCFSLSSGIISITVQGCGGVRTRLAFDLPCLVLPSSLFCCHWDNASPSTSDPRRDEPAIPLIDERDQTDMSTSTMAASPPRTPARRTRVAKVPGGLAQPQFAEGPAAASIGRARRVPTSPHSPHPTNLHHSPLYRTASPRIPDGELARRHTTTATPTASPRRAQFGVPLPPTSPPGHLRQRSKTEPYGVAGESYGIPALEEQQQPRERPHGEGHGRKSSAYAALAALSGLGVGHPNSRTGHVRGGGGSLSQSAPNGASGQVTTPGSTPPLSADAETERAGTNGRLLTPPATPPRCSLVVVGDELVCGSGGACVHDGDPRPAFNARKASAQCRQLEGYVSFAAVEGLGEPPSPGPDGDLDDEEAGKKRGSLGAGIVGFWRAGSGRRASALCPPEFWVYAADGQDGTVYYVDQESES